MGHVILGWDGEDAAAPARRAAVRDRHLAVLRHWAASGRLNLAVPLFRADGTAAGSVMILGEEDEVGTREYLMEEPFARDGVWLSYQMRPFRIASLPYQPLPSGTLPSGTLPSGTLPSGPTPSAMTHCVLIAEDQEGAAPRRAAARDAHFDRVAGFAADGTLACGGALLTPKGEMVGSVAITRHPDAEAARAFWAEDPYVTQGVWGRMAFYPTRFAPLPYPPLPGTPAEE